MRMIGPSRRQRCLGFTLIELAIIMAISGILLSGYLRYYSVQMEKQRIETTKKRMEELREALTTYALMHHRLPCPASPSGTNSVTNHDGTPVDPCSPDVKQAPDGVIVHIDPNSQDQAQHIWIGVVPTHDLRLGDEQGQDAWGDKFTYAVTRRLTFPFGMAGNPPPFGTIAVEDGTGRSVLDQPNSARYVIVSHGPTGAGAWTPQGVRKPCSETTADSVNCNDGGTFVAAPFSQKPGPTFYDDFVIYDNAAAGGTLLDHLAVCNGRQAFYRPDAPIVDPDGCTQPVNVWPRPPSATASGAIP